VISRARENVGVAVLAEQHRVVVVPAQVKRKQQVLVPEDNDLLAGEFGVRRIDRRIVERALVFKRAHPVSHGSRGQKAAETMQKGAGNLHGSHPCVEIMTNTEIRMTINDESRLTN
jgi:hypothetical protein